MTNDTMDLQALVGKTPDADFLREMIGSAARRLMELEVGGLTGGAYGEKDVDRLAQRNGYRERDWENPGGHRRTAHPPLTQGQLFPRLPRTPSAGREGADRGRAGGLYPGHLDPLGRRFGKSDGG